MRSCKTWVEGAFAISKRLTKEQAVELSAWLAEEGACCWCLEEDLQHIFADGEPTTADPVSALKALVESFLEPWGLILEGEAEFFRSGRRRTGKVVVEQNVVWTEFRKGKVWCKT